MKNRLSILGVNLDQEKLDKVYDEFLKLADKKKDINDDDILVLAGADRLSISFLRFEFVNTVDVGFYRSSNNICIGTKTIINLVIVFYLHVHFTYIITSLTDSLNSKLFQSHVAY